MTTPDRFDHALVDGLAYRAPQLIAAALAEAGGRRTFQRGLDLGCGTGLMAREMRPLRSGYHRGGSLRPHDRRRPGKRLYDTLVIGDIIATMAAAGDAEYDLITAADVFCYLGDLDPVMSEAARLIRPGGNLAFSVENLSQSTPDKNYALADSLRFRHSEAYILALMTKTGLTIDRLAREPLRNDRGRPIEGLIVIASKSPSGIHT